MTREEIKKGVVDMCEKHGLGWNEAVYLVEDIFNYQDSNGVVIKVERELPKYYCGYVDYEKDDAGEYDMSRPIFHDLYGKFGENQKQALDRAGYVPTIPLIGEK